MTTGGRLAFAWAPQGSCVVKSTAWRFEYTMADGPQELVQPTHCVIKRLMWHAAGADVLAVTLKDMAALSTDDGDERPLSSCGMVMHVDAYTGAFLRLVNVLDVAREASPGFDSLGSDAQARVCGAVSASAASLWCAWVTLWTDVPARDRPSAFYVRPGDGALELHAGRECSRVTVSVDEDARAFTQQALAGVLHSAESDAEREAIAAELNVRSASQRLNVTALTERSTLMPHVVWTTRSHECVMDLGGTPLVALQRELRLYVFGFAGVMGAATLDEEFNRELDSFRASIAATQAQIARELAVLCIVDADADAGASVDVPPVPEVASARVRSSSTSAPMPASAVSTVVAPEAGASDADERQFGDLFDLLNQDGSRRGLTAAQLQRAWPEVTGEELGDAELDELLEAASTPGIVSRADFVRVFRERLA